MITAGIDCGAKNTKTVIMKDGKIIGKGKVLTGFDQNKAIMESRQMALKDAGISEDQVEATFGTGSGKNAIKNVKSLVNDIKAMGKGAHYYFSNARTVADVGAEEGRAAKLDEKGNAVDFAINEKCAAGAGAFIEAMGRALETPLEEMKNRFGSVAAAELGIAINRRTSPGVSQSADSDQLDRGLLCAGPDPAADVSYIEGSSSGHRG